MESLAKVSFRHHSSRDSAWDSESSWSVKLTADTQFILRKERKGKTVCHSVFCVNKDYYFKTVQISSGSFASSSIGWIWLWVGALAIHSKKKKKKVRKFIPMGWTFLNLEMSKESWKWLLATWMNDAKGLQHIVILIMYAALPLCFETRSC